MCGEAGEEAGERNSEVGRWAVAFPGQVCGDREAKLGSSTCAVS